MDTQYTRHFRILSAVILLAILATGCTTIHPLTVADRPDPHEKIFSHALFDSILGQYVDDSGMVDYQALQSAPMEIESYYQLIATYSPDSHPQRFPDDRHRLAYWINAYNAAAMVIVLKHYPIDSVLDVKNPWLFFFLSNKAGFFLFQRLTFGGSTTSLYYLENRVVRKRFKDPRVHFVLNCASLGCPRLPQKAFAGALLDDQLDNETRRFLAEPRNFRIDHDQKKIYVSSIFDWYKNDFTDWYAQQYPDSEASLLNYISLYLPPEKSNAVKKIIDRYTVRFIPYDWDLNDQNASNKSKPDK